MSFRIFYNVQDMTAIVAQVQNPLAGLGNADKTLARACWNGGISAWQTAPQGQPPGDPFDPDCRVIAVDAKVGGQAVTLAQFIALLERMCAVDPINAQYMCAIASDLRTSAREP